MQTNIWITTSLVIECKVVFTLLKLSTMFYCPQYTYHRQEILFINVDICQDFVPFNLALLCSVQSFYVLLPKAADLFQKKENLFYVRLNIFHSQFCCIYISYVVVSHNPHINGWLICFCFSKIYMYVIHKMLILF